MTYKYGVIYTVDTPKDIDPMEFAPPNVDTWELTEQDEEYDDGYYGKGGHHRKWAALLKQEAFDKFIDHTGLYAEDVETMGSLGAPGFGMAELAPAISFVTDEVDAVLGAYVSPLPPKEGVSWEDVRSEVMKKYGPAKF